VGYNAVSIIGLLILFIGVAVSTVLYMQSSMVWLDETFTVPPGSAQARCGSFPSETTLTIYINVVSGGDRDINFWAMDETDWYGFKMDKSFYYYTAPSRQRITTGSLTWTPPANKRICFVYDNTFSLITSKTVYSKITVEQGSVKALAILTTLLSISIGIGLIAAGKASKSKIQSSTVIFS